MAGSIDRMKHDNNKDLRWKKQETISADDYRVFSVERVRSTHETSSREGIFSVIHSSDWVNVLAITADAQVILIRQFRHGTQANTTEIPGGMVDPGEDPLSAAKRELAEETGYRSNRWLCLGASEPNPAIQSNECFMFLALDARQTEAQNLDTNEVIDVSLHPLEKIPNLLYCGEIRHALVLACFGYFLQLTEGWRLPTDAQIESWHPSYLGSHGP